MHAVFMKFGPRKILGCIIDVRGQAGGRWERKTESEGGGNGMVGGRERVEIRGRGLRKKSRNLVLFLDVETHPTAALRP